MKTKIILQSELLLNPKLSILRKRLEINKEDIENMDADYLWNDSDHLKLVGEKGRGHIQFIDVKLKTIKYVIIRDIDEFKLSVLVLDMLTQFHSKNFKQFYSPCEPNTWEKWDTVKTGIAYRGGKGYHYSLWKYFTDKS